MLVNVAIQLQNNRLLCIQFIHYFAFALLVLCDSSSHFYWLLPHSHWLRIYAKCNMQHWHCKRFATSQWRTCYFWTTAVATRVNYLWRNRVQAANMNKFHQLFTSICFVCFHSLFQSKPFSSHFRCYLSFLSFNNVKTNSVDFNGKAKQKRTRRRLALDVHDCVELWLLQFESFYYNW